MQCVSIASYCNCVERAKDRERERGRERERENSLFRGSIQCTSGTNNKKLILFPMNNAIYRIMEHECKFFTREKRRHFWIKVILSVKQCNPLFRFWYTVVLLSTDSPALSVFERKVLWKIFAPVRVGNDFRIRSNSEL